MNDGSALANTPLARRINLPLLTFYGLGTILGAGIYVLIGKVAGASGLLAPLAFLVAAIVAGVTALSYCQLVVHFPKSAGEAVYVEQAFQRSLLTIIVGYLIVFTGVVSAATLANGFVGYLQSFWDVGRNTAIVMVVVAMGLVAIWGVAESLTLAAVITLIELTGLLLIVGVAGEGLRYFPEMAGSLLVATNWQQWLGVTSGAFLAFYAFIGFEDMVNLAEEVKQPETTMPKAIIIALLLSSLLYVLVAVVAILGLPLDELAASKAPLRDLVIDDNPEVADWISVISLFAIINGVLIQIIMASRVLYGMSVQGNSFGGFSRVWPRTQTPWLATLFVTTLVAVAALWLPLVTLAKTTSFIILVIFTLVNLALWWLLRSERVQRSAGLHSWPAIGACLCLGLLLMQTIGS